MTDKQFSQVKSPVQILRYFLFLLLLALPVLLSGCGLGGNSNLLSDVKLDSSTLALDGQSGPKAINLNYSVGKEAKVSLVVAGPGGTSFELRKDEARPPGQYFTQINGLVDSTNEGLLQRRLLPNGTYRYTLTAVAGAENATSEGQFTVTGNQSDGAPEVSGLSAFPQVISPNFDALDDEATLNWRTSRPATITVSIAGPNGFNKVLDTLKNQPAQEGSLQFNGLDLQNKPLPDGTYNFTVLAVDKFGQETRGAGKVEIKGGGTPEVVITSAEITPTSIIKGNEVTVTVKVKNTGKVPVRSQGPDSGFTYNSNDVYSSIEGGKYTDRAGFWRIGVDFDANTTAGAVRYPWRWGFGKEFLQPGEETEIVGKIKLEREETKITLYVGLIEEKVALKADRRAVTTINISY